METKLKITETEVKNILHLTKSPEHWFGVKYTMNVYRGCQHKCIYCDSRSECYKVKDFDNELVIKINAAEVLRSELSKKRVKGIIGTGAMTDSYTPYEEVCGVTRKCLEVINDFKFPLNIITKSDLIMRDAQLLKDIGNVCVVFTITTTDDNLAKLIEPFAPLPSQRLKAMGQLSAMGITTGVTMMPILPFIEDTPENIVDIVRKSKIHGATFIIPAFSVTTRDIQKLYFFNELDKKFPGMRAKYEKAFGNNYNCPSSNYTELKKIFFSECKQLKIETKMRDFAIGNKYTQLGLDI